MGGGRTSAEDFGVGSKHAIWWISDSKIAFIDAEVKLAPAPATAPALNAYCCMSVGRPLIFAGHLPHLHLCDAGSL